MCPLRLGTTLADPIPSNRGEKALITRHPAERSPDDDPTGVRDLLSSLPQPAPMPDYLVERINATLAAEQARRAATTPSGASVTSVTPLLAPARRRSGRLVLAVAGAAAAVALFAVVGNVLQANLSPKTSAITSAGSSGQAAEGQISAAPRGDAFAQDKTTPSVVPPVLQIQQSGTRYTQAGFVTQARSLGAATSGRPTGSSGSSESYLAADPVGTTSGILSCLDAIGARGAQGVRADLAFYEGRPAVIIVATAHGTTRAYAVGRGCSLGNAALLRPATALP
jgi:hypothetical protein